MQDYNRADLRMVENISMEDSVIHITKYMGNKRKLLEFIVPVLQKQSGQGQTILDLFAGTHSVGFALRSRNRIISNDIQQYTLPIGLGLICNRTAAKRRFSELWKMLSSAYQRNCDELTVALKHPLSEEQILLQDYRSTRSTPNNDDQEYRSEIFGRYKSIMSKVPYYASDSSLGFELRDSRSSELQTLFSDWIIARKENPRVFPYALFSMYYANSYFGIAQSIAIDSLRYAIDSVFPEGNVSIDSKALRNICLSAMIYAASYCVAAPGHFAQFLTLDSESASRYKAIMHHRMQSVLDKFANKINEIYRRLEPSPFENECYCRDYRYMLADSAVMDTVDLIYADPPYSGVHYSRFYHVLETLVRYDYPESRYFGRYRDDRHQSAFCQKNNVEAEFIHLIETASEQRKALVISYPNTGLISVPRLVELCRRYYPEPQSVTDNNQDHVHSTLGGKSGQARKRVVESLIVCTKPS